MADVELDHLGNLRDRSDVIVIEPMSAVHFQAEAMREFGRGGDYAPLLLAFCPRRVAVTSGVNLNGVSADCFGAFDLRLHRIDEQRDVNAAILQPGDGVFDSLLVRDDIKAAFGGELLAFLRHEASVLRTK